MIDLTKNLGEAAWKAYAQTELASISTGDQSFCKLPNHVKIAWERAAEAVVKAYHHNITENAMSLMDNDEIPMSYPENP